MSDHVARTTPARRRSAGARGQATTTPVAVVVDDPVAIAERCWDAGYTVRVHDDPAGAVSLFLADPFGREIALIGRTSTTYPSAIAAGEEQR